MSDKIWKEGASGEPKFSDKFVALGKIKEYSKITYGLSSPPAGFNSCHGVRGTQFSDDEFVIYNHNQQKLDYLVEFSSNW
jgi:poly [ADP-ribose] polymerase